MQRRKTECQVTELISACGYSIITISITIGLHGDTNRAVKLVAILNAFPARFVRVKPGVIRLQCMSEYLLQTYFECEQKISELKQVHPDSSRIDYWEDIKKWVTQRIHACNGIPELKEIHKTQVPIKKQRKARKQHGLRPSIRFKVLKRDGYSCQICGRTSEDGVKLEVDHKMPKSQGGDNSLENLWTLCFDCNRGKGVRAL